MPVIDVAALQLGASFGDGLRVTALLINNDFIAVGTDSGCVLAFAAVDSSGAAQCIYACALHCGAVHCLSASASSLGNGLFASAGRDAVPAVQSSIDLFSRDASACGSRVRRLRGHTLPVAAMTFFANGVWLATLGIGGRLIVFDAASRAALCDVRVGFAARCVALSPDESVCFIGGAALARVDLFAKARLLDPLAAAHYATGQRGGGGGGAGAVVRYEWPKGLKDHKGQLDPKEEEEGSSSSSSSSSSCSALFVRSLCASGGGGLTAVFGRRGPLDSLRSESAVARATWTHSTADFWISRDFCEVDNDNNDNNGNGSEETKEPERASRIRAIVLDTSDAAPVVRCAPYGRGEWCTARVQTVAPPLLLPSAETKTETETETETDSDAAQAAALQAECDELVRRIREVLASHAAEGIKRKRPRGEAATAAVE